MEEMDDVDRMEQRRWIDWNVWTGFWPFTRQRFTRLAELKEKLTSLGIGGAFVSPTEAILDQDPWPANRRLLADVGDDDFFSPVVIVDLSHADWEEQVQLAVRHGRVRMIKLLPGYHRYALDERSLAPLVRQTAPNRLIVSIQLRVADRRGQHPLMLVPDLDMVATVKALSFFPQQPFVLNNASIGEVSEALMSLNHVWLDIANVEHVDLLPQLAAGPRFKRFLLATHSPFYFPEANVYKLRFTDADKRLVEQVAIRNGESLLRFWERKGGDGERTDDAV